MAFTVNVPVPVIVIAEDNVIFPDTVTPFVKVKIFEYPVPFVKSSVLQTNEVAFNTQFPLLLEKKASSALVGTAPVASPPSVKLQLEAKFQEVDPVFLK